MVVKQLDYRFGNNSRGAAAGQFADAFIGDGDDSLEFGIAALFHPDLKRAAFDLGFDLVRVDAADLKRDALCAAFLEDEFVETAGNGDLIERREAARYGGLSIGAETEQEKG